MEISCFPTIRWISQRQHNSQVGFIPVSIVLYLFNDVLHNIFCCVVNLGSVLYATLVPLVLGVWGTPDLILSSLGKILEWVLNKVKKKRISVVAIGMRFKITNTFIGTACLLL